MAHIVTHPSKNPHAVALGRKGGQANKGRTSEAKAAAARQNGLKGGRPKGPQQAYTPRQKG